MTANPDDCRRSLALTEGATRCGLYSKLAFERMARKVEDLRRLFESCDQSWDQTAYLMLMRTVSDPGNRGNFEEIARRVRFSTICREGPAVPTIEALLFGTAGLLESCRDDAYTAELKSSFEHLRHKHDIRPLDPRSWVIRGSRPANHPRLRLAQVAVLLSRIGHLTATILECRTGEEVERTFCAEASQYWSSYYNPSSAKDHSTKRLGTDKARLLGINLAAVLQTFYGQQHGRGEYEMQAVNLWESLHAESNRYVDFWKYGDFAPRNAFESQALLQLSTEYCLRERCGQCPLATLRRYEAGR